MALLKTNRFSGNRAVRTLGALTLGAAMTMGGLSFAWAGDVKPSPSEVQALGYNSLIFQDEFNGSELDTTKWGYEYSCFDPKQRSQAQYTDSKENANVSGGNLHIVAKYDPQRQKWDSRTRSMVTVDRECTRVVNGRSETYKAPFSSAMVQTRDNKGVKFAAYGDFYAEARMKLPSAVSSWPAFWMTGTAPKGFPAHGEIDVVEAKGWDPHYLQANVHTPRVGNPQKTEQHAGQLGGGGTSQSQFHVYGVEKNGNSITFYLDGRKAHTVTYDQVKGDNPFKNPANGMVLRLNQMVGGSFLSSDKGDTTYTDAIPYKSQYEGAGAEMLVDYVRVWQKNPNLKTEVTPSPTTEAPKPTVQPTTAQPTTPTPNVTTTNPPRFRIANPRPIVRPTTPAASTPTPTVAAQPTLTTTETPAPLVQPTTVEPTTAAPTAAAEDSARENQTDSVVTASTEPTVNDKPSLSELLLDPARQQALSSETAAQDAAPVGAHDTVASAQTGEQTVAQNSASSRVLATTGSSVVPFVISTLFALVGAAMLLWPANPANAQHMSSKR